MALPVYLIDPFTSKPFAGNPTAVGILSVKISSETMLSVANELNLPVTAFIRQLKNSDDFEIRYFTPITEIQACGHATLNISLTAKNGLDSASGNSSIIDN